MSGKAIQAGELAVRTSVVGLTESTGDLEKLSQEIVKTARQTNKSSKSIAKYTKLISGLVAINVIQRNFRALWNLFDDTAERMDKIAKQAKRMGLEVGEAARFSTMAQFAGSNAQDLETALNSMTRNIGNFKQGLGEAKIAFENMGISAESFANMDMKEQFLFLTDEINKFGSEADRAALRMKIFGESGNKIAPLTNAGAEGIERINQALREMGIGPAKEVAEQFEKYNDIMTVLKMKFVSIADKISIALVPSVIEAMVQMIAFTDVTADNWKMIGDELGKIFNAQKDTNAAGSVMVDLLSAVEVIVSGISAYFSFMRTMMYALVGSWAKIFHYAQKIIPFFESDFFLNQSKQSFGQMEESANKMKESLDRMFGTGQRNADMYARMGQETSKIRDLMTEIEGIAAEMGEKRASENAQLEQALAQEKERKKLLEEQAKAAERRGAAINLGDMNAGAIIRRGVGAEKTIERIRTKHMEQYLKQIEKNTANALRLEAL